MPCCDIADAQTVGHTGQRCKFDAGIAQHAGTGRAPGAVLRAERFHHLLFELFCTVLLDKRYAQLARHCLSGPHSRIVSRRKADDHRLHVKALVAQDLDAYRGIHAAGKRDKDLVLLFKGAEAAAAADFIRHEENSFYAFSKISKKPAARPRAKAHGRAAVHSFLRRGKGNYASQAQAWQSSSSLPTIGSGSTPWRR